MPLRARCATFNTSLDSPVWKPCRKRLRICNSTLNVQNSRKLTSVSHWYCMICAVSHSYSKFIVAYDGFAIRPGCVKWIKWKTKQKWLTARTTQFHQFTIFAAAHHDQCCETCALRWASSKQSYYIISLRAIIKAIFIHSPLRVFPCATQMIPELSWQVCPINHVGKPHISEEGHTQRQYDDVKIALLVRTRDCRSRSRQFNFNKDTKNREVKIY